MKRKASSLQALILIVLLLSLSVLLFLHYREAGVVLENTMNSQAGLPEAPVRLPVETAQQENVSFAPPETPPVEESVVTTEKNTQTDIEKTDSYRVESSFESASDDSRANDLPIIMDTDD